MAHVAWPSYAYMLTHWPTCFRNSLTAGPAQPSTNTFRDALQIGKVSQACRCLSTKITTCKPATQPLRQGTQ